MSVIKDIFVVLLLCVCVSLSVGAVIVLRLSSAPLFV